MAWLRSYWLMLRFDYGQSRLILPLLVGIQLILAVGTAIMYGFFMPDVTKTAATYIVTGGPAIAVIPIGLAILPMGVAEQRISGTFDCLWTLPVPRTAIMAAALTFFGLLTVPGVALTLWLGSAWYGLSLSISPAIVPALVLTTLMAASVGTALGHAMPNPHFVPMTTTFIMLVAMMFSPIAMPIENYPGWLAEVHRVLPLYHMGVVVRDGLTSGLVRDVAASYGVLAIWTAGGWAVTAWIVGRRH